MNEIELLQEKNAKLENELIQMQIKLSKVKFKHFYETHKKIIQLLANDCKNNRKLGIHILDDLWIDENLNNKS